MSRDIIGGSDVMVLESLFEMAVLIAILFIGGPVLFYLVLWMHAQRIKEQQDLGLRQREIWYDENGHKHW